MSGFPKAIDMVYKNLTANNKFPFVVLNLEIPPHDVDVNVHPTKKEVRYKNPNQIFNFIYSSIEAGLSNYVEKSYPKTEQSNSFQFDMSNSNSNVVPFTTDSKEIYVDEKVIRFMFQIWG